MSSEVLAQSLMNDSPPNGKLNGQYLSDSEDLKSRINSSLIDEKTDGNGQGPSKVVHFRNLFPECTDSNIVKLAIPFGSIENLVFSKKTNQVLIEMKNLEDAIAMVDHYNKYPLYIQSRSLGVQFSKHTKLELKTENPYVSQAIKQANHSVDADIAGANSTNPKTILRVSIENVVGYQMNNLILYKIFHIYGIVLRIIIYTKNEKFYAFVEYEKPHQAHVAMTHLNDQNIFSGFCTLKVDFSKSKGPLEVRQPSVKCRDYTKNPITPKEEQYLKKIQSARSYGLGLKGLCSLGLPMSYHANNQSLISPMSQANPNALSELSCQLCMLAWEMGYALTPQAALATANFIANTAQNNCACHYDGETTNGSQMTNGRHNMLNEFHSKTNGNSASINGINGNGQINGVSMIPHDNMSLQHTNGTNRNNHTSVNYNRNIPPPFMNFSVHSNNGNSRLFQLPINLVLIVSNLNEAKVNPDSLFTLFGVYGDVMRVKVMFNHKNSALVQYNHPAQASIAMHYLNNIPLWGRQIKVSMSKHHEIQLPKGTEEDSSTLTKDYSNSILHRFRKPMSKNFHNIYPPCDVLHLSNIPLNVEENEVKELFESRGYTIKACKFKLLEKRMALVQLSSLEKAVEALIDIHNVQLGEKSNLRVSFSKSGI